MLLVNASQDQTDVCVRFLSSPPRTEMWALFCIINRPVAFLSVFCSLGETVASVKSMGDLASASMELRFPFLSSPVYI